MEPAKEEVSSLTIGEVSINRETREVIACGDRTELTLKEFELLTYLMEHINRVVTRDELLDHIWGYDYDGETRTLDMHIKTLRQKLHDGPGRHGFSAAGFSDDPQSFSFLHRERNAVYGFNHTVIGIKISLEIFNFK